MLQACSGLLTLCYAAILSGATTVLGWQLFFAKPLAAQSAWQCGTKPVHVLANHASVLLVASSRDCYAVLAGYHYHLVPELTNQAGQFVMH